MLEALEQALVDEAVEHGQLVGAALHDEADDGAQHVLCDVHAVLEVAEGHLGLDHPELGGVPARVGVLGAERGAKGVDVTKGHGKALGLELAGHGEVGGAAKEVLAPVDGAVLGERRVGGVDRGDAEHLAGAFGVRGGDDGRVDVDEALALEVLVDGSRGDGAHAEDGAEEVGARTQVLDGTQELDGGALLLQRVVLGGGTLDHDALGLDLEGLRRVGRELELAGDDEGGGDAAGGDLVVVGEPVARHDDLQVLEAAAVVHGDEAKVLHVTDGADPAADGDGGAAKGLGGRVEGLDLGALHDGASLGGAVS